MTFFIFLALAALTYTCISLYSKLQSMNKAQEQIMKCMAYASEVNPKICKLESRISLIEKSNQWFEEYLVKSSGTQKLVADPQTKTFKAATSESDISAIPVDEMIRRQAQRATRDEQIAALHKPESLRNMTQTEMVNHNLKIMDIHYHGNRWGELQIGLPLSSISHPQSTNPLPDGADINTDVLEVVEMEFPGMEEYQCSACGETRIATPGKEFSNDNDELLCPHCYEVSIDEE